MLKGAVQLFRDPPRSAAHAAAASAHSTGGPEDDDDADAAADAMRVQARRGVPRRAWPAGAGWAG